MKLSYAKYGKSKDVVCLGKWCLFTGPELHLKREVLEQIRDEAQEAAGEDPAWEVIEAESLSAGEVLQRCQTGALFGGARVVVVQSIERMEAGEQKKLAKAVKPLPESVTVVLVTHETGGRRGGKAVGEPLQRAVEREGLVIQFTSLTKPEAKTWARDRAKRRGKKLEPAAVSKLVDQKVGTGLAELEAEIEKLSLFVGDLEIIAASHVDELTPRVLEDDVYRVVDAVGRGEAGRAVDIVRRLLAEKRAAPGRIVGVLAQTVRLIWQTKLLMERGWRPGRDIDGETAALLPQEKRKNALAEFKRLSWLAGRTVKQARAFSWERLTRAVRALADCDRALKGIDRRLGDNAADIEILVAQLCCDIEAPARQGPRTGGMP